MEIKNSKNWVRFSQEQALFGSSLITFVAFAVRYILHPYIEPYAVFHFFIVGTLLTQYLYGYKFATYSMVVGIVLGNYFFVAPYGTFNEFTSKDFIVSLNFAIVTAVAIMFMESLRRSLYARELLLKVMSSRYTISLHRENDRIFYAKKTSEAWSILEELLTDFDRIIFLKFGDTDYKLEPLFYKLAKKFGLNDQVGTWQSAIHPEDLDALMAQLDGELGGAKSEKAFSVRFLGPDQAYETHQVLVERFAFLGKSLAILKLTEA